MGRDRKTLEIIVVLFRNENLLGLSLSQFYSPPVYNSFIASKEAKHALQLKSISVSCI